MVNEAVRHRLLGELWAEIRSVNVENLRNSPAAARAVEAGASPEDVALAMTAAAYEAVLRALHLLTGVEDIEALAESGAMDMLHEDLLSADPSGREGEDLFA